MIYLDNAATTLRKPPCVIDAVVQAMQTMGKQAECCGQLRRRRMLALLALAVPTLLHGLWDFLLAAGSRWAVIAFYAFVAAFFITADVCLRRASRTDSRL